MPTANAATTTFEAPHSCTRDLSVQDARTVVLVVSSVEEDRRTLARMLASHACPRYWKATVEEAADWLTLNRARVVVCDRSLPDGNWRDLWLQIRELPDPPRFIVSADWTDARLWAQVLNLGAWDVIVKPYDANEVTRILQQVCGKREYLA